MVIPLYTLQRSHPSHASSKDNLSRSGQQICDEREKYAEALIEKRLVPDALVVDAARPRDAGVAAFTAFIAQQVAQSLEALLQSDSSNSKYEPLTVWTSQQNHPNEIRMYPYINAFFAYVSDEIDVAHAASGGSFDRLRILLPFEQTNINPVGADDHTRTDILLRSVVDSDQSLSDKPNYKDFVAVVEVKHRAREEQQALGQLITYNRNLYANQDSRRFTWGFTICGSVVKAGVLSNDNVFMSSSMDVTDPTGREELVKLLAYMSYCAEDQLGYDPTIRLNSDGSIKEIDVYDQETNSKHTYALLGVIAAATRGFGRHTRCYLCRPLLALPTDKLVVVKNAWAYAARSKNNSNSGNVRSEVALMQRIRDGLAALDDMDDKYAKLIHGGAVQIAKGGSTAEDNTVTAFGMLIPPESQRQLEFRIHQCIAMVPWCLPLQKVDNADQLIIAVADVMEAHTAIFKECGILHRDISLNNMLFQPLPDNTVKGVLIDFDCAEDKTRKRQSRRPERTGTPPYMSIGNLENSNVERTQLDDWESLVYVLCWLGTTGINLEDEEDYERSKWLPIHEWQGDNPVKVAAAKRAKLSSAGSFFGHILEKFLKPKHYQHLDAVVSRLYVTLFFNKSLSFLAHGTMSVTSRELIMRGLFDQRALQEETAKYRDTNQSTELRDPFERRVPHSAQIVDDLLEILLDERQSALERVWKRTEETHSGFTTQ